jgi:hypothetical protein
MLQNGHLEGNWAKLARFSVLKYGLIDSGPCGLRTGVARSLILDQFASRVATERSVVRSGNECLDAFLRWPTDDYHVLYF